VPSSDVVPYRVVLAMLKQPATIRYKLSRPSLSLPQASSYDAVPHRTGDCTNVSCCSPLQVVDTTVEGQPKATNKKNTTSDMRETTPFLYVAR
jgi:hypothetical protein